MGYDTFFEGKFILDRPLAPEHRRVLVELAEEEHVPGDAGKPLVEARSGRPPIYCQWRPTRDGTGIEWDDGEKFYGWLEWLECIVDRYLAPWGYLLSGQVRWQGEQIGDAGVIYVENNRIEAVSDVNPGPSWDRRFLSVK